MLEQQNICRKCILPDGFLGVHLNSEGLCDFCSDHEHKNINWSRIKIDSKIREKALIDWNRIVKNMQKNHENVQYDCILGYSGGKDSTALLDYLVNNLGLNPLAVTSDTGFMTQIAKENMKDTLANINVDHVLIENCIPTFTKLYKWHFYNHESNDTFLTRVICDSCSDLIHSIVVKLAIKKEIPYILFGYSPDQIFRYYYEIPRNEIIHKWKPMLLFSNRFFDKSDSEWYLNDEELKIEYLPRVLLPYHVIPYKEQKIVNLVEAKNYIKKGHADPLLTNCNVVHAATFYNLHRYGGILYAYQYAELVRQNPQERKKWLRILGIVVPLILKNKFKEKEVSDFLESISLSKSKLLELIYTQIEQDPKKRQIESIIHLFEK